MKHPLNEQQQEVFNTCIDYVKGNKSYRSECIEGFAGTGKTTTILEIIEAVSKLFLNFKIAVTAPTNKAVRVLKDNFPYENNNLSFITIHKLLGLKPVIDDKGNQNFMADLFGENIRIQDFHLLIIDEVSMLDDKLFIELYKNRDIKIIFMGDPCQIPPINKIDSIPLQSLLRDEHMINCNRLTQIMRQADGNPIIEASFLIRNNISKNINFKNQFKTDITETGIGMKVLDLTVKENQYELVADLRRIFVSDEFKADANHAKVIAWRNEVVDRFNTKIREMIYGKEIGKICIGEKLIADSPIVEKKNGPDVNILFNTNDEFEVISYELENHGNLKIYRATVSFEDYKGGKKTKIIKILHEDDESKYRNNLRRISSKAKELYKTDSMKAKQQWHLYYEYLQMFAQVKYNYAITAHKSQGSTYNNCIVHVKDISGNPKTIERNRILYTAFTRPKNLLILGV